MIHEIEAHLAVEQAAIHMGARDGYEALGPERPAGPPQQIHRKRGRRPAPAGQQVVVFGLKHQGHAAAFGARTRGGQAAIPC